MIINQLDSVMFNQIKGRNMTGHVQHNELQLVFVDGSGEALYYPDDKGVIIGLDKTVSSTIKIFLEAKEKIKRYCFHYQSGRSVKPLIYGTNRRTISKRFPMAH